MEFRSPVKYNYKEKVLTTGNYTNESLNTRNT